MSRAQQSLGRFVLHQHSTMWLLSDMRALVCFFVCVQETIPAFQDGNWHVSLHPLSPFLKRYGPQADMLHQLQTSTVAVVKDCFHAVEVACAEDFFEDPVWVVSRFFNRRAVVRSRPPSSLPRPIFCHCLAPLACSLHVYIAV